MPLPPPPLRITPSWGYDLAQSEKLVRWVWNLSQKAADRLGHRIRTKGIVLQQGRTGFPVGGLCNGRIRVYINHLEFRPCILESEVTGECQPVASWREALVCVLAHELRHAMGAAGDLEGEKLCEVFGRDMLNIWRTQHHQRIYQCEKLAWESETQTQIENEQSKNAGALPTEARSPHGESHGDLDWGPDHRAKPRGLEAGKRRGIGGRANEVSGGEGRVAAKRQPQNAVAKATGRPTRGRDVVQTPLGGKPARGRAQGPGVPSDARRARYVRHTNARGGVYQDSILVDTVKVRDTLLQPTMGLGATDAQIAAIFGVRTSKVKWIFSKACKNLRGTLEGVMRDVGLNPLDHGDRTLIAKALAEVFEERRQRNQDRTNDSRPS